MSRKFRNLLFIEGITEFVVATLLVVKGYKDKKPKMLKFGVIWIYLFAIMAVVRAGMIRKHLETIEDLENEIDELRLQ